jgi:hypothetical protein
VALRWAVYEREGIERADARDYNKWALLTHRPADAAATLDAIASRKDEATAEVVALVQAAPIERLGDAWRGPNESLNRYSLDGGSRENPGWQLPGADLVARAGRTDELTATLARAEAEKQRKKAEKQQAEAASNEELIQKILSKPWPLDSDGDPETYAAKGTPLAVDRDPRIVQHREAACAAVEAARQRFAAGLAAVVADFGDESQRARQAEGVLPEGEALALLRDRVLFARLDGFDRYQRLTAADIDHGDDCYLPKAQFSVEGLDELDASTYERLVAIRTAAGDGATVIARKHEGWCVVRDCDGGSVTRRSIHVSVTWNGRTFSREYAA